MNIKATATICLLTLSASSLCGQPDGLRNQHFRIDTLHFYGQRIFMQRFDDKDINLYMDGNAPVNRVAWGLLDMQNNLERMKQDVVNNRPITNLAAVQRCLDAIASADPGFDLTRYVEEYRFYRRFVPVKSGASTVSAAPKQENSSATESKKEVRVGREKTAWERDRDILNAEDPNEITAYDKALVYGYDSRFWHESDDPARLAWEKIQNVNYSKLRRAEDSEKTAREHKQWEDHQKFLKDFAATRKKNFTKAFGPAVAQKLLARKVWIGMSMAMVDSMFLWPDDETRTTTREGIAISWFFKGEGPSNPVRPDLDTWLVFDATTKKLIAIEE